MSIPSAVGKALSVFRCNIVDAGNAMVSLACEAESTAVGNEFYDAMSMSVLGSVPFSTYTIATEPEIKVITGQGAINTYIRIQMGGKKRHKDILEHMNNVGTHLAEDFSCKVLSDKDPSAWTSMVKEATSNVGVFFKEIGLKAIEGPAIHILLLPASFKTENLASLYIYGGAKASGYILVSQEPNEETEKKIQAALLAGLVACYCDFIQAYAPERWAEVLRILNEETNNLTSCKQRLREVPIVNLFAQCRKRESRKVIMTRLNSTAKIYRLMTVLIQTHELSLTDS